MASGRIVIFTGGTLAEWSLAWAEPGSTIVGADRGALFLLRHGIRPDIALGDFDSVTESEREEIRSGCGAFVEVDPVWKDQTDTEMAFRYAIGQNPREIVLVGALGTRLDHSLANVHLLRIGLESGISCSIVDEHNEVRLTDSTLELRRNGFRYVSLLPLTVEVTGVTLTGLQYPLHKATLTLGQSLGISNVLVEDVGHIEIESGLLLVIRSRD